MKIYQQTLSPDHGPLRHLYTYGYCRHSPTCSQYTIQMIEKRGAIIGSLLGLKQILTCNPFTKPSDEKLMELTRKTLQ